MFRTVLTLILFLLFLAGPQAGAVTPAISYQGRIVKPDGTSLDGNSVTFTLNIVFADTNCVVYSETHANIDMSKSDGVFKLLIGKGTRINSNSLDFKDIFSPYLTIAPGTGGCIDGFSKTENDTLQLVMTFDDGKRSQTLAGIDLTANPMAFETLNVGGVPSSNVLRFTDAIASPLPAAQWTELLALLNGTSTQYLRSPAGQLTLAAGGIDENINITPSGTGSTLISGNVGIGTTAPGSTLHVAGANGFPATSGTIQTAGTLRIGATVSQGVLDMGIDGATSTAWLQSTTKNELNHKNNLVLNPNGGNVGIGTLSPSAPLHVTNLNGVNNTYDGIARFTHTSTSVAQSGIGALLQIYNQNDEGTSVLTTDFGGLLTNVTNGSESGAFVVRTGTAGVMNERFRINNTGNVGIGTNSPSAKLEVNGVIKSLRSLTIYVDPTRDDDSGEGFTLATAKKNLGSALNLADSIPISRVQIRIANTSENLRVVMGTAATLTNKNIQISASSQSTVYIDWDYPINVDNVSMRFGLLGWERGCNILVNTSTMFITDTGFFYLALNQGNLITFNANNQSMFWERYLNHVASNTRIVGDYWKPGASTIIAAPGVTGSKIVTDYYSGQKIYIEGAVPDNFIDSTVDATGVHYNRNISSIANGNVGIGTASPAYKLDVNGDINIASAKALRFGGTSVCTSSGCTSSSDERLKQNIVPLENSLTKILKLQGVEYDYRDKSKYEEAHQIGVIAQDVESVFPEVVKTDSHSGLKSVAYDHLVAPIIEAIKEIHQRLVMLGTRQEAQQGVLARKAETREVAALRDENSFLKAEINQLKKTAAEQREANDELRLRIEKLEKSFELK
ncbi:MAG: hypothetical protein RJB66_1541 [Pseudomonadota bacterium]|jgi:hypothetical protein